MRAERKKQADAEHDHRLAGQVSLHPDSSFVLNDPE